MSGLSNEYGSRPRFASAAVSSCLSSRIVTPPSSRMIQRPAKASEANLPGTAWPILQSALHAWMLGSGEKERGRIAHSLGKTFEWFAKPDPIDAASHRGFHAGIGQRRV